MSQLNVNKIINRTGTGGPVLTGLSTVSGSLEVSSNLDVTGNTTVSGNLGSVGIVTATGAVISGTATCTTLSATGDITLGAGNSITVGDTFIQQNSVGLGTTTTAGRNGIGNTAVGTLVYNVTTKGVEVYDGTNWQTGLQTFEATGGTEDTSSRPGYKVHTFTSPGTLVVQGPSITAEYLVIAGGGGGGGYGGGGGGAGGYLTGSDLSIQPGTYTIQIGGGGNHLAPPSTDSSPGTPSFINHPGITSITSTGGGRGGGYNTPFASAVGGPGGSGGGGGAKPTGGPGSPGGTGVSSPVRQGYDGGLAYHNPGCCLQGGGGGGASANGTNGTSAVGGTGGDGLSSSINGTATTRGGGGGGNRGPSGGGAGGAGGGGSNTPTSTAPEYEGTDNTGGGGAGFPGAGNGGSGIVIIAYPTA